MRFYEGIGVIGIAVSVNQMLSPLVENKFIHLAFFFMSLLLLIDQPKSTQSKSKAKKQ